MCGRNVRCAVAGLAVLSVLVGAGTGRAADVATEETMAGINLSLDKYMDVILAEEEAGGQRETRAAEDKKNGEGITITAEEISSKKASATVVESLDDEVTTEETAGEGTSHLKLNLAYERLGVAQVNSCLNVRAKPDKNSRVVGKMMRNSGCNIRSIKKGWARIVSGKVRGYVKASYLVKDKKAERLAKKIANLRICVTTETLNVRSLPSTDAHVYDEISRKDEYDIVRQDLTEEWVKTYVARYCKKSDLEEIDLDEMYDNLENWMCIQIDNEKAFVSRDFVEVTFNLDRAVKVRPIKNIVSRTSGSSDSSDSSDSPGSDSTDDPSLLSDIVDYAMQFLGNPYVWGGTSLTNGTDCSGFVMRIYEHFGYSLPRTSASQAEATRTVSSSDVQPGDLFFYGSSGVSHVAMYIGNGQIIHASSRRTGIKISSAYYRSPIKIGRVIGG